MKLACRTFRLCSLLVVSALAAFHAAWLGNAVRENNRRQRTVAAFREVGLTTTFGRGREVRLWAEPEFDDDCLRKSLRVLQAYDGPIELMFNETRVTDACAADLCAIQNLHALYLDDTQVGDITVEKLADSQLTLRTLSLQRTQVSDDGVNKFATLTTIEYLDLSDTQVSDEGLVSTRDLKSLSMLSLVRTNVTGAFLRHLPSQSKLWYLDLSGTRVTDESAPSISRLPCLATLKLSQTGITDLSRMGRIETLRSLDVSNTNIQDLRPLLDAKHLSELNIVHTRVRDADLEQFVAGRSRGHPVTRIHVSADQFKSEVVRRLKWVDGVYFVKY